MSDSLIADCKDIITNGYKLIFESYSYGNTISGYNDNVYTLYLIVPYQHHLTKEQIEEERLWTFCNDSVDGAFKSYMLLNGIDSKDGLQVALALSRDLYLIRIIGTKSGNISYTQNGINEPFDISDYDSMRYQDYLEGKEFP